MLVEFLHRGELATAEPARVDRRCRVGSLEFSILRNLVTDRHVLLEPFVRSEHLVAQGADDFGQLVLL